MGQVLGALKPRLILLKRETQAKVPDPHGLSPMPKLILMALTVY